MVQHCRLVTCLSLEMIVFTAKDVLIWAIQIERGAKQRKKVT